MFGILSKKFQSIFSSLGSNKKLTEQNLQEAVRAMRLALLDADVSYGVAKNFIKRVKEKSIGKAVLKSISPKDQLTKIVHDELCDLMGGGETSLPIDRHPGVIMLCGLQGGGKTTQSAKLAFMLKKQRKKTLLAACDLQRPAAIDQLEKLGSQIEVPVYVDRRQKDPSKVAKAALEKAEKEAFDLLIIDTAGRLHLDEELMDELEKLKNSIKPHATLFVANSATGQDAVNTAKRFEEQISITGTILTMLDGDTRGGAAISIREVTGKPLLFEGVGEKMTDLQPFNPHSMADRILGMGDVINLVRKVEGHLDQEESKKIEKKLKKATFSYEDFLKQMRSFKRMGSLKSLLQMVPGVSNMDGLEASEEEIKKSESIILSMTTEERLGLEELIHLRRLRIAKGSGTSIDEVNRMVKNFKRIKQMMKNMPGFGRKLKKESGLKEKLKEFRSIKENFPHFP